MANEEGAGNDLEEPLLVPKPVEPSTWVLVVFAVSTTLFGSSACALVHFKHGLQTGDDWYKPRLVQMAVMHGVSAVTIIFCGILLYPSVRGLSYEKEPGVEHRWDTVKWTLTQVVAWSHLSSGTSFVRSWDQVAWKYKEFWLMQTYFFISGYLSTPQPTNKRLQAVWRLVGAYFVNQFGYYALTRLEYTYDWAPIKDTLLGGVYTKEDVLHRNVFWYLWSPSGPLYYLPNLIGMRLMAPWWMQLKWPLTGAVIVQVLILYLKEEQWGQLSFLAMESMLTFFPFYISGVLARRSSRALNTVLDWRGSWWAALFASLTFLGFCFNGTWIGFYEKYDSTHEWFNWNTGRLSSCFQGILGTHGSAHLPYAWYIVIGGNFVRYTMVFATIVLFSRKDPVPYITAMGKRSISNYLMHWYVVLLLLMTPVATEQYYGPTKNILIVIFVILQSNFWMSLPVYNLVRPIFLLPNLDLILVDPL